MAHGFSSGFRHAGVWVSYRTTVRQFGNFLLHNDSSWWGPAALSKATPECAAQPGEGLVLVGVALRPSLAAKPQAQARRRLHFRLLCAGQGRRWRRRGHLEGGSAGARVSGPAEGGQEPLQ